jgi:PST family polysaccharide transporter
LAASAGLNSSGVRQIASETGDPATQKYTVRTLIFALFSQGIIGAIGVLIFYTPLSLLISPNGDETVNIAYVALAVMLATFAFSQVAILQGMRLVKQYAIQVIVSAFVTTIVGIGFVYTFGSAGLVSFIVLQPASFILVGMFYTKRHLPYSIFSLSLKRAFPIWAKMVKLGLVIMLGAMAMPLTLLMTRQLIASEYSMIEAGLFSASWILTIYYVGFLLSAMGADYFPRLSEIITDRRKVTFAINAQAQIALTVGGPCIIILVGFPEIVLSILYAPEFGAASPILQWQAIGNIFKICSWSIGFAVLAASRSYIYFILQIHWNLLFFSLTWIFLPYYGIEIVGISFLVAYTFQFIFSYLVVKHILHFKLAKFTKLLIFIITVFSIGILFTYRYDVNLARIISIFFSIGTAYFGFRAIIKRDDDEL